MSLGRFLLRTETVAAAPEATKAATREKPVSAREYAARFPTDADCDAEVQRDPAHALLREQQRRERDDAGAADPEQQQRRVDAVREREVADRQREVLREIYAAFQSENAVRATATPDPTPSDTPKRAARSRSSRSSSTT